jgi:phage tail protein X
VGDYPPGNDEPGTGDCSRPANQWSLAWWLDYEVCRVLYAFSWQPVHSATMVAMPGIANTYEPFRSAYEIGEGIAAMQTEIATAVYGSTPYVNTGGPQTPIPDMFKAPANSPWNGAPLTIPDLDPKRTTTSQFSTYCNHRMLTVLGSVMTPGYCFVLNMLRDLGVLIWFQLLIDIFAVMSVIRQILSTIKFYPLVFNGGGKEA